MQLFILLSLLIIGGCATITSDNKPQTVLIETNPSGANIEVRKFELWETVAKGKSPIIVALNNASGWENRLYSDKYYQSGEGRFEGRIPIAYRIYVSMPGYVEEIIPIYAKKQVGTKLGNAVVGGLFLPAGLLMMIIDETNGAGVDVDNNRMNIKLYADTPEGKIKRSIEINTNKTIAYKDDDDAVIYYTSQIIKDVPDYYDAYILRASVFIKIGNYNSSFSDIEKALAIKSDSCEAYKLRGMANKQKGNIEQSKNDYAEALKLNPKYSEVYLERAKLYYKNSQFDLANNDIEKACDMGLQQACGYKF